MPSNFPKKTWVDLPSTTTAIDAEDLNRMEDGIAAANDYQAGGVYFLAKSGSVWPSRPTPRTDVMFIWTGALPAPSGMVGYDKHFVS